MASFYLCPAVHHTWFVPGGNLPATGAQLFTYVAGSSTKTTVYKNDQGSASHTNPIVLDSGGNLPNGSEIWLPTGVTIDVVFAPATDTDPPGSPYFTLEDLSGINDVLSSASEWQSGPVPTFVSGTQFVLQGDQSPTFKNGRRLRSTNTGGTVYSRITSNIVSSGSTTVNVVSDSGTLDSGLSAVSYGLLDPQFTSIDEYHVNKLGSAVASAGNGTTNIWGIAGNSVHITGTNSIVNFSSASYAGASRDVIFDGSLVLTHNATTNVLSGAQNISTNAGDYARVFSDGASTRVLDYQRADGTPTAGPQASSAVFVGPSSGANAIPTFRKLVGAESALILLVEKVGSSTSNIAFTTSDISWSDYDELEFRLYGFRPVTDTATLVARLSITGGSTYVSSNSYNYGGMVVNQVSSQSFSGVGGLPYAQLYSNATNFGQTNNTTYGAMGKFVLFVPNTSAVFKHMISDMNYTDQNQLVARASNAQTLVVANPINGLQFLYAAGNIAVGTVRLYGLRKS